MRMNQMFPILLSTTVLTPAGFDGSLLQVSYESGDDIPEAYRPLYTEKDGKFELTGIAGLKTQTDVNKLSESLRKERGDHKRLRDSIRGTFGESPNFEEIRTTLDSVEELTAQLEAAGNPKDNKAVETLVEARVKAKLAPMERELATLKTQVTEKDGVINTFTTEKRTRSIHDSVREAATKLKLLPEAMDDALMLAERNSEVNEDGNVAIKESGEDPVVWLTNMQSKKPHWWAPSSGGGAQPGGNKNFGKNPWSAESWNMTEQGRMFKENPTRANQMAASAGTKVGALRPPAKK